MVVLAAGRHRLVPDCDGLAAGRAFRLAGGRFVLGLVSVKERKEAWAVLMGWYGMRHANGGTGPQDPQAFEFGGQLLHYAQVLILNSGSVSNQQGGASFYLQRP